MAGTNLGNPSIQSEQVPNGFYTEFRPSFQYLIPVTVNLLQVKFQNSEASPFDTHGIIMTVFIVATHVHAITLSKVLQSNQNRNCLPLTKLICHMSGALAYGSLLLILVPPFGWLILSSCALQFIGVLHNSYQQIFELLYAIFVGAFGDLFILLFKKILHVFFHPREQESSTNSGEPEASAGDPLPVENV